MGAIRRSSGNNNHGGAHGIDLAPMLDFVLNLLIFFIITAVFVKEVALDVSRPKGDNAPASANDDSKSAIAIQIAESGDIFIDRRLTDLRAVRANVERIHALNPKKGVMIIADNLAMTGMLIQVIDQVHQGGLYDITFATGK